MSLNGAQRIVAVGALVLLLGLGLFPPWQQAAERETAYRKDIGRTFVLSPPAPIAVDCYFGGCKTAPPSYFHVLLYRELLSAQLLAVFGFAVVALWMFRTRRDGTRASIVSRRTRLEFSLLLASLFPPTGTFPLASLLLDIPRQLIRRDELWLIPAIMVVIVYAFCALIIYGLLTLTLWFRGAGYQMGLGKSDGQ